jgi:hypothetical protein
MCKRSRESIDHLLLHCEIAIALWSAIFNRVGLAWVMPNRVVDLLLVGEGWEAVLKAQQCGRWFLLAFCSVFEREINGRSYKDLESTVVKLKSFFFKTLYYWTAALNLNWLSFHDFLDLFLFLTRCFSHLLFMYLSYTFCAFNDISFIYQNKIKRKIKNKKKKKKKRKKREKLIQHHSPERRIEKSKPA